VTATLPSRELPDAATDGRVDKHTTPVLGSENRLKLAVFSANMAGGANLTTAPEAPRVTWPESVALARAADRAGLDAMIPVARWRGMGSPSRSAAHRSFETFTWAAGIAAVTERISVFATFHVPVSHPVSAAKQIATVDHISGGRFGLNIVAGWNEDDFRMFGIRQKEHDDRYAVASEWITFLERIWAADGEFDFSGEHFDSTHVLSEPKPLQTPGPVVMNAGFSPPGRQFAGRYADIAFALLPDVASAGSAVARMKAEPRSEGRRPLSVFGAAHVVCADTEREARRQWERMVHEVGDHEAAANALRMLVPNSQSADFDREGMAASAIAGFFALPFVGTPEQVVEQMLALSDAGVDGLAVSWLDYAAGIAQYDEVLKPLMVQAGLRAG